MQTAEEIYRRLILNAAKVWGYSPEEMEQEGFDPLIGLLLGGVSKELEKAYHELADSKSRIVTDLATHLTPDVLTNVLPAHGIMHALPIEVEEIAYKEAQFVADKRTDEGNEQIVFAPANDFTLVKASVKYLAFKNTIFEQQLHKKEAVSKAITGKKLPANEVWLGIDIDKRMRNLDGFRFFLDWSFDPDKLTYLEYLQQTKWSFGDTELDIKIGLEDYNIEDFGTNNNVPMYIDQVRKSIVERYSAHFVNIVMDDYNLFGDTKTFVTPNRLAEAFGQGEVSALKGNLIWINIVFPQLLSHKSLEYVNCNLNCFPALNCMYYSRNISLKERKTFFPVQCDGSFLSINSLLDKEGKKVVDQRAETNNDEDQVTYIFKEKGIQRFDHREAQELLDYLFDVLRDESFAFNKYNINIQSSTLKNLRQQVNTLIDETKRDKRRKINDNPFLIFNTNEIPQIVKIDYCSTLGELANKNCGRQ
ncbi:MAG: type VI secretion system baseplate subunit TssF [Chitinophagales bacterium]